MIVSSDFSIPQLPNSIKVRVFFAKNIEKKRFHRHDRNCYYFCESNIGVIDFIVGCRNMIKIPKNINF